MKKLVIFAALVMIATAGFSQVTATASPAKSDVAMAAFDGESFDFGKVKVGIPVTHEFKFTNKSKVTMVITNVQASCGCTTPDWSKDPIAPGGTGFVKATFNAAGVGAFDKSVTVMANVENGAVMLRIKGEVVANQ